MKKVLALVLAVMMLSTMAFAIDPDGVPGTVAPGGKIKLTVGSDDVVKADKGALSFEQANNEFLGADYGALAETKMLTKALTSDNYKIGRVKYEEGKNLIDDVTIDDDDEAIVITFADSDAYAKAKNFDVEIDIDGKARDTEDIVVKLTGTVGYGHFTVPLNDDEVDLDDIGLAGSLENNFVAFEKDSGANGVAYSTMVYDVDDLSMEVRVYDGDEFYLYCDTDPDTDVLKANADVDGDMYFYNFKGEPTFNSTAKLYFYNADEDCYVYEINNGKLTEAGRYNDDEGCWVVNARTLGAYVVSTEKLVNADKTDTTEPEVTNPDTGANDVVGIAAALGVVALISGAAVSLKK